MSFSQQRPFSPDGLETPSRSQGGGPQTPLSLQPTSQRSSARNLFLDLPIAWRLTLGFVVAALVAALASGIVGIQRTQSLSRQTDFYHNLLQLNTSLTTGHSFLELMGSKLQQTLDDANAPHPSHETLAADTGAITNLTNLYTQTLSTYAQTDLLDQHPDQLGLLDEAGDSGLASQQHTLTDSAQRTWQFYRVAQQQILDSISSGDLKGAQLILQQQGQPTNADALSALHSLIQLNDRLASAVDDATNVEIHNQLLTTLLATASAFLAIALVGWFISETLVRRLRHLHRVTRAVEEGQINERVQVTGRDEIADVSVAVNSMVDTIVGLLEETRQQRDALAGAAEHLFSDMRIVNAGDLRVSAPVSNDPIGMLANAFNFTVGRFRRFILRTQTTIEQLDVISRQSQERSSSFISFVRAQLRDTPTPHAQSAPAMAFTKVPPVAAASSASQRPGLHKPALQNVTAEGASSLAQQVQQTQNMLVGTMRDDLNKRLSNTRETVEKANISIGRLSELISSRSGSFSGNVTEKMTQAQIQELLALEKLVGRLAWEVQQMQFNATNNFKKIDAAFAGLTHLAAERPAPSALEFSDASSTLSEVQFQEFVRQAGGFAVEVNSLSKRLAAILQEMRSGITPFRLEGAASMGEMTRSTANPAFTEQAFPPSPSGKLASNSGRLASNW